ncbi:MAG: alpha/beta fold hydrolase [Candidatus Sumerlaeia bacterium]|nr:alpha/beta fold hydrolase [Candidatus Sumerlaeia bacterium]
MLIQRIQLDESRLLLLSEGGARDAARRGTVLMYHGLWSHKDANLAELEALARAGFLAVGVDQWGHGERSTEETRRHLDPEAPDFRERFHDAIRRGAAEIPGLLNELIAERAAYEDRLGVCGISMGGHLAYQALVIEPRFKAAVAVLGSPRWNDPLPSPADRIERFRAPALLSQTAGRDDLVPPDRARDFHRSLAEQFGDPDRHAYIEYPESGHMMRGDDWAECWRRTVEWFERWL